MIHAHELFLKALGLTNKKILENLKYPSFFLRTIQDLENKLNATKAVLADCGEYADPQFVDGIERDVALLEAVLGRVIAQQELIDIKTQSICLN